MSNSSTSRPPARVATQTALSVQLAVCALLGVAVVVSIVVGANVGFLPRSASIGTTSSAGGRAPELVSEATTSSSGGPGQVVKVSVLVGDVEHHGEIPEDQKHTLFGRSIGISSSFYNRKRLASIASSRKADPRKALESSGISAEGVNESSPRATSAVPTTVGNLTVIEDSVSQEALNSPSTVSLTPSQAEGGSANRPENSQQGGSSTADQSQRQDKAIHDAPTTQVVVFGTGEFGQLGLGEGIPEKKKPALVKALNGLHIQDIAVGGMHTIALARKVRGPSDLLGGDHLQGRASSCIGNAYQLWSWGVNDEGALGRVTPGPGSAEIIRDEEDDDSKTNILEENVPGPVLGFLKQVQVPDAQNQVAKPGEPDLLPFPLLSKVATGDSHSCALSVDGRVFCWGTYRETTTEFKGFPDSLSASPSQVSAPSSVGEETPSSASTEPTTSHVTSERTSTSDNSNINNGNGLTSSTSRNKIPRARFPVEINADNFFNGEKIVDIACGENHTVALTEKGHVYTWGINTWGQLGRGDAVEQTSCDTLLSKAKDGKKGQCVLAFPAKIGDPMARTALEESPTRSSSPAFICRKIGVSSDATFVVTADDRGYSVGLDGDGQLGYFVFGQFSRRLKDMADLRGFPAKNLRFIGGGQGYTVAIVDDADEGKDGRSQMLYTWGSNPLFSLQQQDQAKETNGVAFGFVASGSTEDSKLPEAKNVAFGFGATAKVDSTETASSLTFGAFPDSVSAAPTAVPSTAASSRRITPASSWEAMDSSGLDSVSAFEKTIVTSNQLDHNGEGSFPVNEEFLGTQEAPERAKAVEAHQNSQVVDETTTKQLATTTKDRMLNKTFSLVPAEPPAEVTEGKGVSFLAEQPPQQTSFVFGESPQSNNKVQQEDQFGSTPPAPGFNPTLRPSSSTGVPTASLFGGARVVSIACGGDHALVTTEKGELYSFGRATMYKLGNQEDQQDGDVEVKNAHRIPFKTKSALKVGAGAHHSVVVVEDKDI
ncbi:unnamed protein product [Amoebophrya sp. A25]|nr:unnamed protein product [Amoebophrya sp. A25]|eukprot:GSA25T00003195001.1